MAIGLQISVFSDAKEVLFDAPLQEEVVAIGAGSLQSNAITGDNREMRLVRLFCDADCFVTWGANPTATTDGTSGRALGAENPEVFGIFAGNKIAVINRVV